MARIQAQGTCATLLLVIFVAVVGFTAPTVSSQTTTTLSGTMYYTALYACPATNSNCLPIRYYFLQTSSGLIGLIFTNGQPNLPNDTYVTVTGTYYQNTSCALPTCVAGNMNVLTISAASETSASRSDLQTTSSGQGSAMLEQGTWIVLLLVAVMVFVALAVLVLVRRKPSGL